MKYSKTSAVLLALAILIQLLIPAVFIAEKYTILQNGKEYKIRVSWLDYEDNVIRLSYDIPNEWENDKKIYAALKNESDGIYRNLELTDSWPEDGAFFKSASVRKFRLPIDEYTCPDLDESGFYDKYNELTQQDHWFYSTIKVNHFKALLTGVYLDDGTPVEEIFR